MDLPTKVRSLRNNAKMTQKEVAKAVNLTPQRYSKIEQGDYKPGIHTITHLALWYDLSREEHAELLCLAMEGKPSVMIDITQMSDSRRALLALTTFPLAIDDEECNNLNEKLWNRIERTAQTS